MRFVMAYSCGKDSSLALYKMIADKRKPVCLITMVREDQQRSWFHGADCQMLAAFEKALNIPMLKCSCAGQNYKQAFESALCKAAEMGAEACVFGDMDIQANRDWEEDCCRKAKLKAIFPLWGAKRLDVAREVVNFNFKCLIKDIDAKKLSREFLGKTLDNNIINKLLEAGVDVCGENGEYHTLVYDGPIFKQPLIFETGAVLRFGSHLAIEVRVIDC